MKPLKEYGNIRALELECSLTNQLTCRWALIYPWLTTRHHTYLAPLLEPLGVEMSKCMIASVTLVLIFIMSIIYLGSRKIQLTLWIHKQPCSLPHMYRLNAEKSIKHYEEWAIKNGVAVDQIRIDSYKRAVGFSKYGLACLLAALIISMSVC